MQFHKTDGAQPGEPGRSHLLHQAFESELFPCDFLHVRQKGLSNALRLADQIKWQ